MHGLFEAVPNFSAGRDPGVLAAIRRAIEGHARVLDVHADADHNRSVFTCVGGADGLVDGLAAGIAVAGALGLAALGIGTGVASAAPPMPGTQRAQDQRPRPGPRGGPGWAPPPPPPPAPFYG